MTDQPSKIEAVDFNDLGARFLKCVEARVHQIENGEGEPMTASEMKNIHDIIKFHKPPDRDEKGQHADTLAVLQEQMRGRGLPDMPDDAEDPATR